MIHYARQHALGMLALLVLLLTVACGCKQQSSSDEASWQRRCKILEEKLEHEKAEKQEALRMQIRLRSATGWAGTGAVGCLVVGAILGSRTKRVAGASGADESTNPGHLEPDSR
jgi:hypothetical protein